jgi:hypothetical protein
MEKTTSKKQRQKYFLLYLTISHCKKPTHTAHLNHAGNATSVMRRGFLNNPAPKAPPRSDHEEEVLSSPSPPEFLNMHLDDDQPVQAQTPPPPLQTNDKEEQLYSTHMALSPTTTATTTALEDDPNWAVERATALPEFWALVAENGDGLVDAWRLMSVCKASRTGVGGFLSTLPGLVVCGGRSQLGGQVRDVWRLDLATLRWEPMPALVTARSSHACCAVRGTAAVLGGRTTTGEGSPISSEVEMLSSGAFVDLPPLSRGGIDGAAAIEVDESGSAAGQVLLLGGEAAHRSVLSTVHLVDLATSACAQQPALLHLRVDHAAARMPDGRIICAGGFDGGARLSSAEVWGPPEQGGEDAAWTWRELPAMSEGRFGCCGCVMSDGRFAVLGGEGMGAPVSSCEALVMGDAAHSHWEPLPSMHDSRYLFACAAVAGCVIVAGGVGRTSAEVYDESRNRWLRLPHNLPNELDSMGSALL